MRIERIKPRCPKGEQPYLTKEGFYELGDPGLRMRLWHLSKNATRVQSIEEAVRLIEQSGFGIRMLCDGKRASLIRPSGIRILRP